MAEYNRITEIQPLHTYWEMKIVRSGLFEGEHLNGYGMMSKEFETEIVTDVNGDYCRAHYGFYTDDVLHGFHLCIETMEGPYNYFEEKVTCGCGEFNNWVLAVKDGKQVIGQNADKRSMSLPDGSELRIDEQNGKIVFCGLYRDGVRNGLGCEWNESGERTDGYWENDLLVKVRSEDRLVDVNE